VIAQQVVLSAQGGQWDETSCQATAPARRLTGACESPWVPVCRGCQSWEGREGGRPRRE